MNTFDIALIVAALGVAALTFTQPPITVIADIIAVYAASVLAGILYRPASQFAVMRFLPDSGTRTLRIVVFVALLIGGALILRGVLRRVAGLMAVSRLAAGPLLGNLLSAGLAVVFALGVVLAVATGPGGVIEGSRVRRFVDLAHRAGLSVQVWTVDAEEDARRLLAWGVTSVQDASVTNGVAEWELFQRLTATYFVDHYSAAVQTLPPASIAILAAALALRTAARPPSPPLSRRSSLSALGASSPIPVLSSWTP